ncbi:hypothetical protein MAP00_006714 [Monascus purpureus]|nr:hypothetical protein MAP00_006714 [Monascus purpureus]
MPDSIKKAAKVAAAGMVRYYTGYRPGDVPGNLPDPYYWWEAGAMFGSLIEYYYYTRDTQYVDMTTQAMLWQVGRDKNYMPDNQTRTLGNDDQAFWALSAMSAAEVKFPDPPPDQPQWLELAQAVFNTQAHRWDTSTCGGGLKWQIFAFNAGYNYKNTVSNGCFFNLASRLAVYTNNETYAQWAERTWDWVNATGLIGPSYQFFDGSDDRKNCTEINHIQWTYNAGLFLLGAANMYNHTNGAEIWKTRLENIIAGLDIFFKDNVMTEVFCENTHCDVDQRSFKAYLSRWMAATTSKAPFTYDLLMPRLRASAAAAALQCNGPDNACGLRWTRGADYDGSTGVGEQMSALDVFQANLADRVPPRVTNSTGGTSKGDPNAGTRNSDEKFLGISEMKIAVGDQVGAGVLTSIFVVATICGVLFMVK